MKYKPEDYSIADTGFYGLADEDIDHYQEKLVKCRKVYTCMNCENEIPAGAYAIRETGFMDGSPVSAYTCIDCMDRWLDEINGVEEGEW